MNDEHSPLSGTQLHAAAAAVLRQGGYFEATTSAGPSDLRLFEDAFGIVAVAVFESWQQLSNGWHLAQGQLVEAITASVHQREPKAWEGYLVLLTSGLLPPGDELVVSDMRNDTNRVRKIVATGEELSDLQQVHDVLLPLLPLALEGIDDSGGGVLEMLTTMLTEHGISLETSRTVVQAFTQNQSILESLHARRLSR